jgi:hypothetical protein
MVFFRGVLRITVFCVRNIYLGYCPTANRSAIFEEVGSSAN